MDLFTLIFIIFFSSTSAYQPVLRIVPLGESFIRPLGSNLMFTCEVYQLGPQLVDINLQWFGTDGLEILDTAGPDRLVYVERDENSPTKKLYFTHIRQEHSGRYMCSGIIEGNTQQQSVNLMLYKEITYDFAPSPQHPAIHTTALIMCRVSGSPTPTISWRYKGIRITDTARYAQDGHGIWIKNITKEDDGLYYCRAEVDSDGRYNEKEINVIVHIPPHVTEKRRTYVGIQSHEFAISCSAIGLPDPKYAFTKDGDRHPLHSTERRTVDADSGDIHFRPLHKEDEGRYNCNASNNVGEDVAEMTLTVQIPPTIYDVKNVTQTENHATTLICSSYGDPAPEMKFQKAGNLFEYSMGDNEDGRITVSNPSAGRLEMIVRNLVPEDMSNYTCKSSNVAGYHERNGTITVQFKPRFPEDHIRRIYTWPGKLRNMTCFSLAEPMPAIEWIRFIYPLFDNETYRVYFMGLNSNLQVRVREIDQGWIYGNYTCRVRNQIGQTDFHIDLHRAMTPGGPKSVSVSLLTSDTVVLEVAPPVDSGGVEVYGYQVEYEDNIRRFYLDEEILIENLRPSTTFLIRVRAMNEVGVGEPVSVTIQTDNVKAPSMLVLTSASMSHSPFEYRITWKKPLTGGRPIREFLFRFRKASHVVQPNDVTQENRLSIDEFKEHDWISRRKEDDEFRPLLSYLLESLQPQTSYEIEVTARNDLGWSAPNDRFIFTTLPGSSPILGSNKSSLPGPFLILFNIIFIAIMTVIIH